MKNQIICFMCEITNENKRFFALLPNEDDSLCEDCAKILVFDPFDKILTNLGEKQMSNGRRNKDGQRTEIPETVCPDNANCSSKCATYDCSVHKDLVRCDEPCNAKNKPETIDELKIALNHWKYHSFYHGCSHGQ